MTRELCYREDDRAMRATARCALYMWTE